MAHIVVVGSCNMDLVVQAPRLPKPGESVIGGVFARFHGGKGANQAVAIARMGGEVTFVGRVGDDDFGREILENLQNESIDTTHVGTDPKEATGVAFIVVDAAGENQIVVAWGANGTVEPGHIDAVAEDIARCAAVLAQNEIPMEAVERVAEIADRCDTLFVLNPAPAATIPDPVYRAVDVLTPNLGELEVLTGRSLETVDDIEAAGRELLAKGVGAVVVTQGEEGSTVITPEESWWTRAVEVDARDTVGAGDCFSGNLTLALAEGKTLKEAVRFATVAAGIAVTRLGARSSLPTREIYNRFLEECST